MIDRESGRPVARLQAALIHQSRVVAALAAALAHADDPAETRRVLDEGRDQLDQAHDDTLRTMELASVSADCHAREAAGQLPLLLEEPRRRP
jgi:hypothetical protein